MLRLAHINKNCKYYYFFAVESHQPNELFLKKINLTAFEKYKLLGKLLNLHLMASLRYLFHKIFFLSYSIALLYNLLFFLELVATNIELEKFFAKILLLLASMEKFVFRLKKMIISCQVVSLYPSEVCEKLYFDYYLIQNLLVPNYSLGMAEQLPK